MLYATQVTNLDFPACLLSVSQSRRVQIVGSSLDITADFRAHIVLHEFLLDLPVWSVLEVGDDAAMDDSNHDGADSQSASPSHKAAAEKLAAGPHLGKRTDKPGVCSVSSLPQHGVAEGLSSWQQFYQDSLVKARVSEDCCIFNEFDVSKGTARPDKLVLTYKTGGTWSCGCPQFPFASRCVHTLSSAKLASLNTPVLAPAEPLPAVITVSQNIWAVQDKGYLRQPVMCDSKRKVGCACAEYLYSFVAV